MNTKVYAFILNKYLGIGKQKKLTCEELIIIYERYY
jgi:hypothetical protein